MRLPGIRRTSPAEKTVGWGNDREAALSWNIITFVTARMQKNDV
jgi:hypothetical protein